MSLNLSDLTLPPHFSGVVRLFPLPNLVLFPGVVQALHIFEPRYRKMTADCLASDNLLTMCLYRDRQGSDEEIEVPAIHEHVCICKIFAQNRLEDGRYNLMIAGLKRAVIRRELAVEQPYRMAEVDVIEDDVSIGDQQLAQLRDQLLQKCREAKLFTSLTKKMDFEKIVNENIPLGLLTDLIAFIGNLQCADRQKILELSDIELRCWKLLEVLGTGEPPDDEMESKFPPDFSSN